MTRSHGRIRRRGLREEREVWATISNGSQDGEYNMWKELIDSGKRVEKMVIEQHERVTEMVKTDCK
jgi:hypothetical protein